MVLPEFAASPWLELVLATPVVFWCAWPFHRAAAVNARHLASTMDTLVSIGVLAAWGYSVVELLQGGMHLYFEVASVVTTFLLVGRFLEARAKDSGKDALRSLLDLGAKDVSVLRIDPQSRITSELRIPVDQLVVGDQFVVRPGEKVATDGIVRDGSSAVDASLVTGESTPVDVSPGDDVTGGSINTHRTHRRRGPQGRRRHDARRHPAPRRDRPDRQGRRPAPRRPRLRDLRARSSSSSRS